MYASRRRLSSSVRCAQGEDGAEDDNDSEDDDGYFVPHGYLSEDEGCEEDEKASRAIRYRTV